jgi:hypothetical protein
MTPEEEQNYKAVYNSLPEPKGDLSFNDAVTEMYSQVLNTLQLCPY